LKFQTDSLPATARVWLSGYRRGTLPPTKPDKIRSRGARVRNFLILSAMAVAATLAFSRATLAQEAAKPAAAPDLSGVWLVEKFQPRLFPNGGAPFTPWAEAKFKATDLRTNDPNLACLPMGVPRFMIAVPYPMEILQMPTRVVIIHEGPQVMRQIYMNRQHPKTRTPAIRVTQLANGKAIRSSWIRSASTIRLGLMVEDFPIARLCMWLNASAASIMTRLWTT